MVKVGEVVVKVGESGRSSLRRGGLSSAVSTLSIASAATLNYEELERRLGHIDDLEPFKSIVTLDDPPPERPSSTPPALPPQPQPADITSLTSLPPASAQPPSIRKPRRSRRNSEPRELRGIPGGQHIRGPLTPDRCLPPSFLPPPSFMAAAGPPVEMTGWRLNQQFDPTAAPDNRHLLGRGGRGGLERRRQEAVLAPEDLPRLYPTQGLPQWSRTAVLDFEEEEAGRKACLTQALVIRVFIGTICTIGASCVVAGIVLGALSGAGTTRLTLCGLMIGVGAVLVAVSGIAWRLTSFDTSSFHPSQPSRCCGLFRRRGGRSHSSLPLFHQITGRHPYFNLTGRPPLPPPHMAPFPFHPPPPSYQASVRDAALLELSRPRPPLGSPPPTYRSHSRTITHPGILERPPSYRSDEDVPVVLVHQRPFSPSGEEREELSPAVVVDEGVELVGAAEPVAVSPPLYRTSIAISGDDAVIDCSAPAPRHLRMPQDQGEIRRSLGPSTGRRLASALRPSQHPFQYSSSPFPDTTPTTAV